MQNILPADLRDDVERFRKFLVNLGRKRSLRDPLTSLVEERRMTPAQMHTLMWVGSDGPLTMGEIARRLATTEKTVTGVVDRLEDAGFAERERDEHDRRVIRVKLTKRGQLTFKTMQQSSLETMGRILGLLEKKERQDLLRLLETMLERLEQSAEHGSKTSK